MFGNIIVVRVAVENQHYNICLRDLKKGRSGGSSPSSSSSSYTSSGKNYRSHNSYGGSCNSYDGTHNSYGGTGSSNDGSNGKRIGLIIDSIVIGFVALICCKVNYSGQDDCDSTTTNNNTKNNYREPILPMKAEDDFLMSVQPAYKD